MVLAVPATLEQSTLAFCHGVYIHPRAERFTDLLRSKCHFDQMASTKPRPSCPRVGCVKLSPTAGPKANWAVVRGLVLGTMCTLTLLTSAT